MPNMKSRLLGSQTITKPFYSMMESSGLVLALSSKSIVYDIPEHPPCLTPILKHNSSFRSDLILFKCFSALSVSDIAGATAPDAGAAETGAETDRIESGLVRLRFDCGNRKESEV